MITIFFSVTAAVQWSISYQELFLVSRVQKKSLLLCNGSVRCQAKTKINFSAAKKGFCTSNSRFQAQRVEWFILLIFFESEMFI